MTNFELWIKACEENKTSLYLLEGEKDIALYKMITERLYKHNYIYSVMYAVWYHDKYICAVPSYLQAYQTYKACISQN